MFAKIKGFGSRKVPVRNAVLVIALMLFAATAIAARYESLTVGKLQVSTVETLSVNHDLNITSPVIADGMMEYTPTALEYTAGTGFEVPTTNDAAWYTVDVTAIADSNLTSTGSSGALAAATAGVTIVLPTPTATFTGRVIPIQKIDSGTTLVPLISFASGATMSSQALPLNSATGVTNVEMDAIGDILYLMPQYNSAVSWWIVNRYIH